LAEVDWVSSLAKAEPRLKGIVAYAPLEKGALARSDLEALVGRPLLKGVRRSLQEEKDAEFCLRPLFIEGVKLLADFGLTFDVCIRAPQLPGVIALARRAPEVAFVLDHCGKPEIRDGKLEPWATDLKALATLPNVTCKLSGLTTEADWKGWEPGDLKPYVEQVLQCFGFDRVLFGSDWPVANLATTYDGWLSVVQEATSFASHSDRLKLFRTNAERIYRL
jgi:L-fuconolactonase